MTGVQTCALPIFCGSCRFHGGPFRNICNGSFDQTNTAKQHVNATDPDGAKGSEKEKQAVYRVYLGNTRFINNWDLVDSSAQHIVGGYLWTRGRDPLYRLAHSENLWERRISIMSSFHFIKRNAFEDTLRLSEILLDDPEDLIHKAVGWMLREIGNRDIKTEERFLIKHYRNMPRTMLRYAIEKFPEKRRKANLKGTI